MLFRSNPVKKGVQGVSDDGHVSDTSLAVLHSSAVPSTGDNLMTSPLVGLFGFAGAALVLAGLGFFRRQEQSDKK